MNRIKPLGILALLAAIAYVAIPLDGDNGWTGFIDDFFVFMAGYTFFMGNRQKSLPNKRMLYTISGTFFIAGMLSLIALILFGE